MADSMTLNSKTGIHLKMILEKPNKLQNKKWNKIQFNFKLDLLY